MSFLLKKLRNIWRSFGRTVLACHPIWLKLGNEGSRSGSIQTFCPARAHLPRKSRKNPGFPGRIFSIEKNCLLRPRFLELPGPGEEIFLHRYFWDWKCSLLPGIFRKKGSDYEKNFHRPRRQENTEDLANRVFRETTEILSSLICWWIFHSDYRTLAHSSRLPYPMIYKHDYACYNIWKHREMTCMNPLWHLKDEIKEK